MSELLIPSVILVDDRPCTTSLAIADCFEKRHCDVMRDIQKLVTEIPEDFHKRNFALMFQKVKIGNGAKRETPFFNVFFDGFILLVMGYTGKKALEMKLAYIAAFNAMREKLEEEKAKKLVAKKQAAIPTKDKYESYLEEVESIRARTFAEIDALLHKGLDLIDVKKSGTGAIVGFTPILLDWLQRVVCQHTPLISSREPLSRALDYSPLYLIRHMEKMQGCK